jgi:hypothetical protein
MSMGDPFLYPVTGIVSVQRDKRGRMIYRVSTDYGWKPISRAKAIELTTIKKRKK